MELHGKNIIAGERINSAATQHFTARGDVARFEEATDAQIHLAFAAAEKAFHALRQISTERRAAFLERIAEEIEALGDDLLATASTETGLPIAERLVGERGRTINQLKMFAVLIREGSWVDARIDRAIADRKPPKPDVRRLLIPIGTVAVFSASNFPLAFSVAGGDTASAFAAGCPVIVKSHPAHPATSELTAIAITKAAIATDIPAGIFSLLHSTRNEMAIAVVQHPLAKAVAFTGSLRGGRTLFDAAARRPNPIPLYAEMGSVNPVFVLPGALRERAETIAQGMKASVTVGVGQLCTCPGLTVGIGGEHFTQFSEKLKALIAEATPATMLYPGILHSYETGTERLKAIAGVETTQSSKTADRSKTEGRPSVFMTDVDTFKRHRDLSEELFGPSTVVVRCNSRDEMEEVARNLEGHLTATIHGTTEDLAEYASLVSILEIKVGRLLFNGFPTGVEVCPSMQHGGPYPATTDSRSTSVGTAAILRFARPVAYQNFPQSALPPELQDAQPAWNLAAREWTMDEGSILTSRFVPARYKGVFPVAPTTFTESGELDLESQKRCIDFMIDAGSNGICILANFSEQFVLSDEERETLTASILRHVAGRVPVIVTTTHFSSRVCIERSRRAQDEGAAMVMVMPPYHGATIRVPEQQIYDFFGELSSGLRIPVMIQDAPVSGTMLVAAFLARMARELDQVSYFKIEAPGTAAKLRELLRLGGNAIEGPWDGEEGITLFADLEAGATGAMTGGGYPEGIRQIVDAHASGRREEAFAAYERWLPLINYENRQCGLLAAKALMKEGGIIECDAPRHPFPPLHPAVRAGLMETARRLNPMVLRWGK